MIARTLALSVALAGCTPSLASLVARHQHREALCAARFGGEGPSGDTRVLDMLANDIEPSVHLRALTRDELTSAYGDAGARVAATFQVVLITTWTRPSNFNDPLEVHLVGANGPWTEAPVNRVALAGVTGETLPGLRRVTDGPGVADRFLAATSSPGGLLAGVGELATLGTVPFLELFGFVRPTTTTEYAPTDAEYRARAPVAQALYELLAPQTNYTRGLRRRGALFLRAHDAPVSLVVTTHFVAAGSEFTCELGERYTVPLGASHDLDAQLRARFGDAVVRLRDLRGTRETLRPNALQR